VSDDKAPEGGSFRVRNDPPSAFYRVHVDIAYTEEASPAAIRKQLVDCYVLARRELDRRFGPAPQDDRQSAGERR
jgi:hypothetical protein